jgi:subtilisin family serine protease
MGKTHVILLSVLLFNINLRNSPAQSSSVSTADSLDKTYLNWYNLDPKTDHVQGASVNRAYNELLKSKAPVEKIVVAVIDGGVDINHDDLKGKIWTNKNEIPGNGIDDDNNGYIDDMNGWNFLGNAKGENIDYENFEFARLLKKYEPVFRNVENGDTLSSGQQNNYALYLRCREEFETKTSEYEGMESMVNTFEISLFKADSILKQYFQKEVFTYDEVNKIKSAPDAVKRSKTFYRFIYKNGFTPEFLGEMREYTNSNLKYHLDTAFTPRDIISDNTEDISDKYYGNNDVKGALSEHGTFVSGIIAANRSNGFGTDGIADNVEIMSVRTVPDGDERDKDVALAIRYAVDNGARIINMSFGKDFSPQKQFVDEAIQYAEDHNVLLVHAAGNDSKDIDYQENYPTRNTNDQHTVGTWLEVGASANKADKALCGSFSNYGKKEVDLFAPGVNVTSLNPENTYLMGDGTSYSSPVVAGVAALILSYYPKLSAVQLKEIIMNSVTQYKNKKVYLPIETGKPQKVLFSGLSVTGGVVNAYQALKLAENMATEQ